MLEQQRGEPDLINHLHRLISEVTDEQIVAAAATLRAVAPRFDRGHPGRSQMTTSLRAVPALGPNRALKLPKTVERTLDNGLTVIAVRRPSVPLVEVRLRIPFAKAHLARAAMLTQTILSGTSTMSTVDIAAELQKVGGGLSAGADPDRLLISGNALVVGLDRLLDILADVLTDAAYPNEEVGTERARLVDRIRVAQSQPSHLARVALLKRMYGKHPYAVQTPTPEQVEAVGRGRPAHPARRAGPPGRRDAGTRRRHRRRRRRSPPPSGPSPSGTATASTARCRRRRSSSPAR